MLPSNDGSIQKKKKKVDISCASNRPPTAIKSGFDCDILKNFQLNT